MADYGVAMKHISNERTDALLKEWQRLAAIACNAPGTGDYERAQALKAHQAYQQALLEADNVQNTRT